MYANKLLSIRVLPRHYPELENLNIIKNDLKQTNWFIDSYEIKITL